jgi:hypothetical protein
VAFFIDTLAISFVFLIIVNDLSKAASQKWTRLSFYCLILLYSFLVILFPPHNVFSYDVFGYYMYLPLTFKYHDPTIQNYDIITEILNKYHPSETFYQALKWDNGNWVMRYPVGLSVLFSPFYFVADLVAPYTKYSADGFSRPYQLSVLYGCLLYTIIGLSFLKRILLKLFNDKTSALTLLGIALGTNYFFHTTIHGQGTMSHNLLFSLYAVIIYLTMKWHESFEKKHIVWLSFFIGLAALCRATEIICVLIPLFYGVTGLASMKQKLRLLYSYKGQLLIFSLILIATGFLQLGYYKYASGRFFINPYGAGNPGEGLEPLHPHLLKVLFSFRKGWFIYTPLMLFVSVGFYWLYKYNRRLFTPVFIYALLHLYIVSSWSCWWFGACFGNRALVASYAALSIPLGYFFKEILQRRTKFLYLALLGIFIALNVFQSWQMSVGIMDSTNMSRAYYWSTFLQTTPPTTEQTKLLLKGQSNSEIEFFTKEDSLTHSLHYAFLEKFENANQQISPNQLSKSVSHSGSYSLLTGNNSVDSYSIEIPHEQITEKSYTWIKGIVWVYSEFDVDSLDAVFRINLKHKGWIFKPVEYKLDHSNFRPKQWNKLEYYFMTPDDLRSTKDLVCITFINKGKRRIFIDDMMLLSYEPIHDKSVF